jgi:signal transduction histidine kinase/putative methionine-R-sulfoxide reductase with GAF domain
VVTASPRRRKADDRTASGEFDIASIARDLERSRKVATAFMDVGLALGQSHDLDALLDVVLSRIVSTLEADRATLYLLDRKKNRLVSRIMQGGTPRQIHLAVGEGIAGSVAETGETVLVKDAYEDPRFNPVWDLTSGYRTRTILAVPMRDTEGRTNGVVQVLNKKSGTFTADDAEILTALATSAGIAVENAMLLRSLASKNAELMAAKEQLENRVRDLRLLFDLERAMGHVSSLEELFASVLKEAVKTMKARAGAIALRHGPTDEMQLYLLPANARKTRHVPWTRGDGFLADVVKQGEVVLTNDARSDVRFDSGTEDLVGDGEACVLAVPIDGEGDRPLGALALFGKDEGGTFSEEDRTLLLLFAANASTSIRLQMAREGREREERLTTIGRLLSGVMHDLKTPLGVLSGYLQLMVQADDRAQREEFGELAHKQFGLISAMQREVLEFARGERSMFVRKVYLQAFFDDIARQIEGILARAGVELVMELEDRGTARFDEGKLTRLIHNLARNAAEAMAPSGQGSGRLTINVARGPNAALVITFTDTGPGIPKEIRHRLFQSFVTSGKKGGTGLGLAITKKIAEEHGGTIEALPSTPGGGAVFRLTLPQGAPPP